MQLNDSAFLRKMLLILKSIYWAWLALWILDMLCLMSALFIMPEDNSFSEFVLYTNLVYAGFIHFSMQSLSVIIIVISIIRRKVSAWELLAFSLLCGVMFFFVPNWHT